MEPECIIIMGPTAVGKTALAVRLAQKYGLDIVSADSRQVYKYLDIGTGKDLSLYQQAQVNYHLIDIVLPNFDYTLAHYRQDFISTLTNLKNSNKKFIWCGGTGLYFLAILKNYQDMLIPTSTQLRLTLEKKEDKELFEIYKSLPKLPHNDISTKRRLIRAIEKGFYLIKNNIQLSSIPAFNYKAFCLIEKREKIIQNINIRLEYRFKAGLIEEVETLLKNNLISYEKLIKLGLEYKFIALYLQGNLTKLAIHQFSKRQMTFFRKIQKEGISISWVYEDEFKKKFNLTT
jgi:tRNA dimethylallyltransferase